MEAIRSKNTTQVSAILTHLGTIGVKPKKEQVEVSMTKEEKAILIKFKPPRTPAGTPRDNLTLLFEKLGPLLDVNRFVPEGLTPLHMAAGVGSVEIMTLLVDAWDADVTISVWDYSVFQHALNSVSKGLTTEKALDWLQVRGANLSLNPNSKIGKYTQTFVDIKQASDKAIEDEKLEKKKKKARDKKKSRQKKAKSPTCIK